MEICFATNNRHKLKEISEILGYNFKILSLEDIGCRDELSENQDTLEGNSREKAEYVYQKYDILCIADDTGLEVSALNGAPGVKSARYAGPQRDSMDNISLLLENLQEVSERTARFRTVITLLGNHEDMQFEGIVTGKIIENLRGKEGFGYDPVFVPEGETRTFAEMSLHEKNIISHRARAFRKLINYLQSRKNPTRT